ncbi:alpha/beta hydrolase [Lacihabitans sp. LS3-19]|uniref:alpha/beta hydrolase family protein n=1 Tax=Lacihabitans sp. LS3-19 TaxID=2487335 RepID=UPI0020CF2B08|nr:alpha/beta hydrolase [Lacihabitans sp. LS3-19]MCP9768400.1 alpha/beta hydrolase [Lacihabitans sp. LS3-19]
MKKLTFLLLFFSFQTVFGQAIEGQWNGVLSVQGTQLRLVFHIKKTGETYVSTMDSPDQGAKDIPVTSTVFDGKKINLEVTNAGIKYEGELDGESKITGTFSQGNFKTAMELGREKVAVKRVLKPQDPIEPYGYYSEEVKFENKSDNITLAGTLTLPKKAGKYPVVILISGSGPQNRDEELLGHRPFLVIADHLTKNGIGVLRYDDRGTFESTGKFKGATSEDFAKDVEAALSYLLTRDDIEKSKIGLIGHSEGGLIAPMVASRNKDVAFIVLLAGPGISGAELLPIQTSLIEKANGASKAEVKKSKKLSSEIFEIVAKSNDNTKLEADLTTKLKTIYAKSSPNERKKAGTEDEFLKTQLTTILDPWFLNFLKHDPRATLENVKCPVLAINGEKDLQVPPKENLNAIEKSLKKGGNSDVTILEFPNLNHLFQESTTGSPKEYAKIEQTFAPVALESISTWVLKRVK